jgi:hypothetical protein
MKQDLANSKEKPLTVLQECI